KLDALIKLLETVEVRVYKLRGTNPIADIYWMSSEIAENNISVDDIRNRLTNFCEKFMNNHVFRTYLDGDIYRNGAVKYILSEYTNDNFDMTTYRDLTVEHIFSEDPNYDPSSYGFDEDYDYEKNRVGNLTLLEQRINKGIGNDPPKNKITAYIKSIVKDTLNIAGEIQNGKFSKENVDNRRKNIIDFCIKRFKIE
ncbi:MAG: HNH endonuclease family protein, partial [Treponema sp.]|nr:HNH endonuclease family protein [Treponema sp.]